MSVPAKFSPVNSGTQALGGSGDQIDISQHWNEMSYEVRLPYLTTARAFQSSQCKLRHLPYQIGPSWEIDGRQPEHEKGW